ncbi:MAG: 4Fe-4S binding protein [Candidatus Omnitrophica bacterium]|nr:4Fe-4S binding protein [Candidatus Omnitrophota bacterium]
MGKQTYKITLKKERCKECLLCIEVCPSKALGVSKDVNKKGYRYIIAVGEDKCIGCARCIMMCPDSGIEIHEN